MSRFITAWVEMTFRGWYSMQCVHPKCQLALTLQPLISKLLGCNFALKFDSHHRHHLSLFPSHPNEKCYPFARREVCCSECVIWSLIDLQKRVIGVNVPPNIHFTVNIGKRLCSKNYKGLMWYCLICLLWQPSMYSVCYLLVDDSIGFRNANYSQMQKSKGD